MPFLPSFLTARRALTRLTIILIAAGTLACDGDQPPLLPDLVPTGLSFDENNVLEVTFENQGRGIVPEGVGSLGIYIDGRSVGGYSFPILANQSFRDPGGALTIRTNFRMAGALRRVSVYIDPGNQIEEENEFQNTMSRNLAPPVIPGPDYTVSDLSLNAEGELRIEVTNIGNTVSPAGLEMRARVIVNEVTQADLTPVIPALAPGASTIITPDPEIAIADGDKVRVLLNANHLFDDIDSTNGVREEILPDGPSFDPYGALLAEPRIRDNIIWRSSAGARSYGDWTPAEQADLRDAILRLERGEPQSLSAPPALLPDGASISPANAWEIYLAHVAQSLWVEVHNAVSWDLTDFSDDELAYLLDGRQLLQYRSPTNSYDFFDYLMGRITAWNPRISWEFLSNHRLVRATELETILGLTDWMRGHLSHTSADDDFSEIFGYAGAPPTDKVLYPLPGVPPHTTAGCWGTSGLYGAVLRAVNIPVQRASITLGGGTHSHPVFPSVDRSMPHGDDPYERTLLPSGGVAPSDSILYTSAEMDTKFLAPVVDCDGGVCNTPGEQASFHMGQDHWQHAFDHVTDYPLYQYAVYGGAYLNDSLLGPRIGGGVVEYVLPYFADAERAAMVAAVEAALTDLGAGDIEAGKMLVIERWNRFGNNR